MISLRGVGYTYTDMGRPALEGVSLDVRQGEWIALVGSNGSGKSTLAKHLNALLVPMQGACFIYGLDSRTEENQWEIRTNVSMVFQNPENQIVSTVVEDDVAFGLENLGLSSEEIRARVNDALSVCGLEEKASKAVYTLSGGQKQRLAIAGALAMNSGCIVLDEPTAMLDPEGRDEVISLLKKLHARGITILHVTHRLEEIYSADRVVLLSGGRIEWQGTPEELFSLKDLNRRSGLEVPPMVILKERLVTSGLIAKDTSPTAEEIGKALCLSS
ncbi:MAG: energy-coupling factor transporter ATPase [Pyramidobacter sp.]|nr:energy-coupling factor transporter ATPase [Pyramidobacter sp.]